MASLVLVGEVVCAFCDWNGMPFVLA